MALYKIADFDQDYRETFQGSDIKGMGIYADGTDEKIGTISDVLVDEDGHFRYLLIDLGFWIFGKKVLLPVGRSRIDYNASRAYAVGITREQADNLPEFNEHDTLDYDYEERVRGVYRNPAEYNQGIFTPVDTSAPVESSIPVNNPVDATRVQQPAVNSAYNRDTYTYDRDPSLYGLNDQNQTLRLYEERLIANKKRQKAGEVTIGKRVETETARVAVPLEKDRVVVERITPADAGRPVAPGEAKFREGEVARVELYEETADIRKEAVVREEVRVRKVVDQETVEAQEQIRREELDVNSGNLPIEER